jgi:hypothetical protein
MMKRAILLTALTALSTASIAVADDADVLREARDRADIEALMWRYVRALDSYNSDAYASVYTEDGQFGAGPNATKGRAALKEMIRGLADARADREAAGETSAPMYHVIANSYIDFVSLDEAHMHSYWMTMFGPAEPGGQPRVAAVGRGIDELVRVDGQWLIRLRNVAPQN